MTVRWSELETVASRLPRFTASWSIASEVWHNFPADLIFDTSGNAASHALQQARLAIDASLPA